MGLVRRLITLSAVAMFMAMSHSVSWAQQPTPFCTRSNCVKTRELLKRICDLIVKEKVTYPTIYIDGYYMRTLVAGYQILLSFE